MKYTLEIIKGTEDIVHQELVEKHQNITFLKSYETEIQFESAEQNIDAFRDLLSALRITKEHGLTRNIFRRDWKVETAPAGINPALAYVLCKIGQVDESDTVLDPFCGAGTIAITASKYCNAKKVLASDVSGKAIDMTIENAKAANLSSKQFTAFRSNVTQLRLQKESISKIITNPPFGIRTGNHEENIKIYKTFAQKTLTILKKNGTLVCITQEKQLFLEAFDLSEFRVAGERIVSQGGLHPTVYVIEKRENSEK